MTKKKKVSTNTDKYVQEIKTSTINIVRRVKKIFVLVGIAWILLALLTLVFLYYMISKKPNEKSPASSFAENITSFLNN